MLYKKLSYNLAIISYEVCIFTNPFRINKEPLIGFTNIICYKNWAILFVRVKWKDTWELPGGHREKGETILECAERELVEETGFKEPDLSFLASWKLIENISKKEHFGHTYICNDFTVGIRPDSEIEEINWFDDYPLNSSYPFIQKELYEKALIKWKELYWS